MRNIHLTPQLVQAVRDAADIVSVASEHTRLVKRGQQYQGLCPVHKEKTPSFGVDPNRGLFYCFGCGAGGDAIRLHMLVTGDDFPAAIETLALRYGVPLPTAATAERNTGAERGRERALAAAQEFFRARLARSATARSYLDGRRVSLELAERFGLGFAPDAWRELIDALNGKVGFADLEAAGLVTRGEKADRPYDRFRNRLMFPIHTASGRLVGFGGRTLGDDRAKYINTAETEDFHKGRLLYGLNLAKRAARETGRLLLVEGYFDVVAAVASGVEATVASMGTALTVEQAKLLSRYAEEVVVGYDGDNAGETAFRRALPILLAEGLAVRRARFGEGEDPDSLRLAQGEEAVVRAVAEARDGVELELERLTEGARANPNLQAKAANAVAEILRPIPDSIVRLGYTRMAADRLGVPVELLRQRLGPEPKDGPSPRAPVRAREVRNLEEQVLELLLSAEGWKPPVEELPPEEIFWDLPCRNIFQAFCTLYRRSGGAAVQIQELTPLLEKDNTALARLGQIVVEGPVTSGSGDLSALLDRLDLRWRKKRLGELAREIEEALRRRDSQHLSRLLEEKTALTLRHHRRR